MMILFSLTLRDLKLAYRRRSEAFTPILFFLIVISLFSIGIGPNSEEISQWGPGMIWVTSILSTLLGLGLLFQSDYEDGSLEQLVISPHFLPMLALSKVIAHWIITGVPLVLISPLVGLTLQIDAIAVKTLVYSLLLGTPTLSLIGAVGAALTVGLKRGGLLLSILILPLYVPILIFGANAVQSAIHGMPVTGHLYILGAFLSLSLGLAPFAIGGALRASIN